MSAGSTFTITLNAETAQALLKISQFLGAVQSGVTKVAEIGAAALGLNGFMHLAEDVIRLGGELQHLHEATGGSIQDLVAIQRVLRETGGSAESLGLFLQRMQKNIVDAAEQGGAAGRVFSELNINLKELATKNATDQFKTLGQAISAIENPAKRTQAVLAVFGKGSGALSGAFSDPKAFAALLSAESEFGNVMARNAEGFHQVEVALGRIGAQGKHMMAGVLDQIAPMFDEFVQRLKSFDLTAVGEKFGAFVTVVINAWKEGKFPEMIGLLIEAGFEIGIEAAVTAWKGLIKTLSYLTSAEGGAIWVSLLNGVMTFGVKATEFLLRMLQEPVVYMAAAFDVLYDQVRVGFQKLGQFLKEVFADALNFFIDKYNRFIAGRFHTGSIQPITTSATAIQPGIGFGAALDRSRSTAADVVSGATDYLNKQLEAARAVLTINGQIAQNDNVRLTALQRLNALIDEQIAKRKQQATVEAGAANAPLQTRLMDLRELERLEKEKLLLLDQQLATVENNYLLTTAEKWEKRREIIEQQRRVYADLAQTLRTRAGMEDGNTREQTLTRADQFEKEANTKGREAGALGANPYSLKEQLGAGITQLRNQFGTTAEQIARSFTSVIGTAVNSVSEGITGLIMGTKTWGQALKGIATTIVTSIVQAIVEMGVKWVVTHVIMGQALAAFHALARALGWEQVAETNAQEADKAPALAVNAANASTSSYGAAAIVGIAAMVAAIGIGLAAALGAFDTGGYTGSGGRMDVAGVVHRGEYVFSAPSVQRIGVGTLEAMHAGGAGPGAAGGGSGGKPGRVVVLTDERKYRDYANDPNFEQTFLDLQEKHGWRYRR